MTRKQATVMFHDLGDDQIPVMLTANIGASLRAKPWQVVPEQFADTFGQSGATAGRDQHAGTPVDQFGHATCSHTKDRHTRSHCFKYYQAEGFLIARVYQQIASADQARQYLAVMLKRQARDLGRRGDRLATTDEQEVIRRAQRTDRIKQQWQLFSGVKRPA